MKLIYCFIMATLLTATVHAQEKEKKNTAKKGHTLSVGTNGIQLKNNDTSNAKSGKEEEDVFAIHWGMLDLGLNNIQDKTNYNNEQAQNFLHVDPSLKNKNLFNLNQGKSVNVNIYPIMTSYRLYKSEHQKIYLVSGIGLQLYNFRFDKPVTYTNNTSPAVIMDTISFKKNKLAFDYLNIPLEVLFKTKVGKTWLVYGGGITGGYRINSWTKQISSERGKQKDHDNFNFQDFNSCLMAELGLEGYFRIYATYQLTSLQSGALDQHPFSIGFRFLGI